MQRIAVLAVPVVLLFLGVVCRAGDLPGNATTDQVLDALDERGKSMKEFTAKVSLTEGNPDLGDVTTRIGQVRFQKKGEDDGRIRVVFDQRQVGNIVHHDEKIEYLLDNGMLIDRNYKKKVEDRRQVIRPGEKINLLKLGEGPFPLPIGQKKEDVYREFDVKLIPPGKDAEKDSADTIQVALKPKAGGRFARQFAVIDIWVNRASKFPAKIVTVARNEERKITKLTDVQINPAPPLTDADFTLPVVDQRTWSLHTEAYRE